MVVRNEQYKGMISDLRFISVHHFHSPNYGFLAVFGFDCQMVLMVFDNMLPNHLAIACHALEIWTLWL
jgi:hypothetical protein